MCLLLFAHQVHPRFPLVVAANRDEFHARPTAPADWWPDGEVLAGRDLEAGGTWMGVTRAGRFAAVTNYRDPASHRAGLRSRGLLVAETLADPRTDAELLDELRAHGPRYNGFNLVFGSADGVYSYANQNGAGRLLAPGLYGLSNHLLETPWPKVQRGRAKLADCLKAERPRIEDLLDLLHDTTRAPDAELPDTGVGLQWERLLAPMFIVSPEYGTRASTVLLVDADGGLQYAERSYDRDGNAVDTRVFRFPREA